LFQKPKEKRGAAPDYLSLSDMQFQKMVENIHSPPNRRDQNFLGVRGSIGHKNEALLEKGLRKGVLEKK